MRRIGPKGSGRFERVAWDAALDLVAEKFNAAEQRYGAESVWPYYYAGTMGLVMRDGINRLRHVKKYSGYHSTICVNPSYSGFAAGVGRVAGPDPREMAKSDLVVIWGGAAILGWVAGGIFASDPVILSLFGGVPAHRLELVAQIIGAIFVLAAGYAWRRLARTPVESNV